MQKSKSTGKRSGTSKASHGAKRATSVADRQSARYAIVKASIIGKNSTAQSIAEQLFTVGEQVPGGALIPPYDPARLYKLFEQVTSLRPNVDAYVTNIESFGHHFTPSIDLASEESDMLIADSILYERANADGIENPLAAKVLQPTQEEVDARKEQLRITARLEFIKLKSFFAFVCPSMSFTELRRQTRQDLEVTGNAYWEVVRNGLGEIVDVYYSSPMYIRLMPLDKDPCTIEERIKVTDITWKERKRRHYYRRFLLYVTGQEVQYFKEFGDKRIVSRQTGKYYESLEELEEKEPDAEPATEIIHFKLHTPSSPYGVPRWIACLPAALGSRELEEVNYGFFKSNTVPPLALLCSGGRLGKGVATRIEDFIEEHIKGTKGMNRILVLEAEGQKVPGESGPKAIPKLQFVPLRDAQQQDAVFQNYDSRSEDKIGKSFRLPRILRGDDSQLNKATAWASLKFADEQIFEPERETFDEYINRKLLTDMQVSFWSFRSNAPIVRDPEKMVEMLERLVKVGILLPREAREICADIFNRAFTDISEEWTNKPLPFVLGQLRKNPEAFLQHLETEAAAKEPQEETPIIQQPTEVFPMTTTFGMPLRPLGAGHDDSE